MFINTVFTKNRKKNGDKLCTTQLKSPFVDYELFFKRSYNFDEQLIYLCITNHQDYEELRKNI
jgi:hypothetical protein